MLELPPANAPGFPSLGTKGMREGGSEAVCLGLFWLSPQSEKFEHASDMDLDWGAGPTAQPGAI